MMKALLLVIILFFSVNIVADQAPKHGFTAEQEEWMASQNSAQAFFEEEWDSLFANEDPLTFGLLENSSVLPVAEYVPNKYLIFSSSYDFNTRDAKRAMAKDLPQNMILVVFTHRKDLSHIQSIRNEYLDVIEADRLKVIYLPKAYQGFWARDGVPVPVIRTNFASGISNFTVVDAVYYHSFEADKEVAAHFSAKLTRHDYYYEGGNFMPNSRGDCLIVNKTQTAQIPDVVFEDHYGCHNLIRFPHVKGIGHADESLKFVSDNHVLTDTESYVSILEDAGFRVTMLPRAERKLETYVNSVIVNGTVFVPIFGESRDEEALNVYRSLGYDKVIGLNSKEISNVGAGSFHCITMSYPDVPFHQVIQGLGGEEL